MSLRLLFLLATGSFCVHSESKIRNTLLLVADDAGFEMGAYANKYCQTPNLDNFAKKSLIFNYAFTSASSCSPSRAQILTGLPSHQNGMYGLHQGVHHFNVFDSVKSLPNVLKENNIFTGIVGKKHVGPPENFKFDFEETEEKHSINQIGRNITNMKLFVRKFLQQAKDSNKPFFLVVAFHDPHRCGHITPQFGEFCERWGSGESDMGTIPDWKPIYYDWRNLEVPYYLPDTEIVKQEIAAQYLTTSRLDQGVGLMLKELEAFGFDKDTFVMYTSDNGPPFPGGRTNFYDAGIKEPMIVFSPENGVRRNQVTSSMTSLLDIYPTILDVFKISTNETKLTGKSLLPLLLQEPPRNDDDAIFGSQSFHEVTMMYPMRMIRTRRYKLIHNINSMSYFPVDQDLYTSPTFQEILNATRSKQYLPWARDLKSYYMRDEWQLFDTKVDPMEKANLVGKPKYMKMFDDLKERLLKWQKDTSDPWICAPHGVLEEQGVYKNSPQCFTLDHDILF